MTPEQRRLRAQIAANARWSKYMAREDQAYLARKAFFARLEREVDPEGKLPPDERAALVRNAAREFSTRLNAAKARKRTPSETDGELARVPLSGHNAVHGLPELHAAPGVRRHRQAGLPLRR
jgi:hypothetical protein